VLDTNLARLRDLDDASILTLTQATLPIALELACSIHVLKRFSSPRWRLGLSCRNPYKPRQMSFTRPWPNWLLSVKRLIQ